MPPETTLSSSAPTTTAPATTTRGTTSRSWCLPSFKSMRASVGSCFGWVGQEAEEIRQGFAEGGLQGGLAEVAETLNEVDRRIRDAGNEVGVALHENLASLIKVLQTGQLKVQIMLNTLNAIDKSNQEVKDSIDPAIALLEKVNSDLIKYIAVMRAGSELLKETGQVGDVALQGKIAATLGEAFDLIPYIKNGLEVARVWGIEDSNGQPIDPNAIAEQLRTALTKAQEKNASLQPIVLTGAALLRVGLTPNPTAPVGAPLVVGTPTATTSDTAVLLANAAATDAPSQGSSTPRPSA